MKDILSIRNLWRRLTSKSPSFFRKLRLRLIAIGVAGGTAMGMLGQFPEAFPSGCWALEICKYMVIAGVVGTVVTSLTVEDNSQARPQ